jgi:hypothetical protein
MYDLKVLPFNRSDETTVKMPRAVSWDILSRLLWQYWIFSIWDLVDLACGQMQVLFDDLRG